MKQVVLLLLLGASLLFAKKTPTSPLFWKVEGTHNTVYLLGSIHVGKAKLYPLPLSIEQAFAQSKTFAIEVNTQNISEQQFLPFVDLGKDSTLSMLFNDTLLTHLKEVIEKQGIPYLAIEHRRPWFFMQYLLMQAIQQAGFSAQYGTETYFLSRQGTKKVDELESFNDQMHLFTTLFTPDYVALTLQEIENAQEDIKELYTAWRVGDSTTLHSLILDSTEANLPPSSPIMQQLFYDRNRAMTHRITLYLSEMSNVFVAVGTGHFLGDRGIIALLKKQGYTVTRIETINEK